MSYDAYNTITAPSQGLFKDKGSRFLAFAYPVAQEDEVKEHIVHLKKEYNDARHHCYAYRLGIIDEKYRVSDDGEPSGTAGKPIYGQFISRNLSDLMVVVVRYFGGTLLGTGGLINAYKMATSECLDAAEIVPRFVKRTFRVEFPYELSGPVLKLVKEEGIEIIRQDFSQICQLTLNVRLLDYNRVVSRFEQLYGAVMHT
ncbi:MAG: YigZ family protein [Bacteroidota bacterium]|nr:MAG: YigZ family protein [Bacteroidota bacterium]